MRGFEQPRELSPEERGDRSESEPMLENIQKMREEQMARRREEVRLEKEGRPDKEPFSVDKLKEFMSFSSEYGKGEVKMTPELIEEMEAEYYLDFKNAKSLKEFAALRQERERSSGG
jgi:hypothetical protein